MKPSLSIAVLAGLLITASASFGQDRFYPPTKPHVPAPIASAARFNLDGTWQFNAQGKTFRTQIEQHGDQLKSFIGIGNLGRSDALLFEGKYANGVIVGQRVTETNTRVAETLTVEDPDHIRTSRSIVLARISPARADDAVCDLQNSSHTQAGYAYDRAIDAAHRNLPNTLNACWLQVSANQGHARAEAVTAMIFRDGEGVPRNPNTAFSWAQKSAAQGDLVGEAVLGQLYGSGLGTQQNEHLSQYWESKANTQLAALRAQQHRQQTQTAQAKSSSGMTQSEIEVLAIVIALWAGSSGGNQSASANEQADTERQRDKDQADQDRRDREDRARDQCTMNGGTVSNGVLSGFKCQ